MTTLEDAIFSKCFIKRVENVSPMEREDCIGKAKEEFPIERIKEEVDSAKHIKAIVIGDTIIDEYHFTTPKGRAIKDPIMSVDYVGHETYAGGILAIANHLGDFVQTISLVTLLGDINSREDYIRKSLHKKVTPTFFVKPRSPTTVKTRFIDHGRGHKLFKVEHINDTLPDDKLEHEIISYLKEELPKYDLAIIGDFGHGFLSDGIIKTIEKHAKYV